MKDSLKDIFLIPFALALDYLFAYLGLRALTICNQIIMGSHFHGADFDLILRFTFRSFEGLFLIGFLYFFYIDIRTLILRNVKRKNDLKVLEKYSSKGKLLLNKAYNIFQNVPFENSLKHSIKIYPLRVLLVTIVLLPLFAFQLFIIFFSIAPSTTAAIFLIFSLGIALSYLCDTKAGQYIARYFLKFIRSLEPDKIEKLQKEVGT